MGVSRAQALAATIVSFADTLDDGFDVSGFVQRLADTCVGIARVADVIVTLADDDGALACVASTSEKQSVHDLFAHQEQFDRQGPSVWSFRTAAFAGGALDDECARRWPVFVQRALEAGFAGVWALPMRRRTEVIGVVNLLSAETTIGADETMAVQTLTDVATIGLLQPRYIERVRVVNRKVQPALDARIVIEQAKGFVAEHAQVDMDAAFALIRGFVRHSGRDLTTVCRDITNGVVHPRALVALARTQQPQRGPNARGPASPISPSASRPFP
jgi:hypothetical protein